LNHSPKPGELAPIQAQTPTFDQSEFRQALGQFATGVTVVTACHPAGGWVGLTVSSFNSVSLAPPLVLWSLALKSSSMAVLRACTHYAINVLSAEQTHLANQFATKNIDRFAGVAWSAGQNGVPLIEGAVATFECFNRSRHEEGDHVIFVGEVERCSHLQAGSPLLYHGGQFYTNAIHPTL
jgi:flavin reductase (DIM6/NTAB) family NADH-FMN oxidoreductase RutF